MRKAPRVKYHECMNYWMTKCRNQHSARWTGDEREAALAPWGSSKYGATACPVCDVCVRFVPVKSKTTETECGPRCTSAVGPSCDCKCGGENHAADHAA